MAALCQFDFPASGAIRKVVSVNVWYDPLRHIPTTFTHVPNILSQDKKIVIEVIKNKRLTAASLHSQMKSLR